MSRSGPKRSPHRLFAAIELPEHVRHEVAGWARGVARGGDRVRVVPSRNLHITLTFIGGQPESEIPSIAAALRESAAPVTGLSTGAPLWLPRRRPRALALEVHDSLGQLAEVQRATARAVAEAVGQPAPDKAWLPHLTAIRLSRGAAVPGPELPVTPAIGFDAEAVTLFRSQLKPEGAEYEALERVEPVR
ncbi:MAG: RNA 2',3'-cyclic phosphodiesterase [Thermoleophilia bacterium]|nr:RNA 2',3'-cyclic phosphodiesterase [Thermoleophilia bacterium]